MTDAVVVVGPSAVRGPGAVDAALAAVALDCIDDELTLVDGEVVSTDRLWRDVLEAAIGGRPDVVLVCPSWWPTTRVDRVEQAARDCAGHVVVLGRRDVLASMSTVLEIGPEVVVVHTDVGRHVIARTGPSEGVIGAVVACVAGLAAVTIDVPSGASSFGAELSRAVRHRGVEVTVVDDHEVSRRARPDEVASREPPRWRAVLTPRAVVLAGASLSVLALVAAALRVDVAPEPTVDATWLLEGRVAVEVPAAWRVERITSGSGSARVQVVSDADGSRAIHLVQARVPDQTLAATADALRTALAAEPEGVFVDFDADAQRARRPVVTYREVRADRRVWWTVLLDRGVRIAIGCQGAVDSAATDDACDRAVGSAHAVS